MKGKDSCCGSGHCCDDTPTKEAFHEGCGCCVNEDAAKVKAQFCPKCKSFDVKYVFELQNLLGMIPKQRCGACGYTDSVFPILETTKGNLSKRNMAKKIKHSPKGGKKR